MYYVVTLCLYINEVSTLCFLIKVIFHFFSCFCFSSLCCSCFSCSCLSCFFFLFSLQNEHSTTYNKLQQLNLTTTTYNKLQRFGQWPGLWQWKQSPVGMANQGVKSVTNKQHTRATTFNNKQEQLPSRLVRKYGCRIKYGWRKNWIL